MFPALIYRLLKPKVVLMIFVNGRIVLTGMILGDLGFLFYLFIYLFIYFYLYFYFSLYLLYLFLLIMF
jgi:hypothetical protein